MPEKTAHLICNAHLDPVWLWNWDDGIGAAIATFRSAADLCEEFDGFVFNHNEAYLYRWIEELEPSLFARIQRLVREGKWHIAGGWYIQPDCNMPSGESIVRQILAGKLWFRRKFSVDVTTALNFDSFGHSRGLVQLLAKAGFDSYIFFRPHDEPLPLPDEQFTWVGYDGSEVAATRSIRGYNCDMGTAAERLEKWIDDYPEREKHLYLWGIGNHGGGPSRKDLSDLASLIQKRDDVRIVHSTPERYFADLRASGKPLPRVERDLNPIFTGCYTSIAGIKQKHRRLENLLYSAEKMASSAAFQGLMPYPKEELDSSLRDLLYGEFHDILPGSCAQPAAESAERTLDHGLEIAARLRLRAFVALASGQKKAKPEETPILVYNPHPFRVAGPVEVELYLWQINWDKERFFMPVVTQNGKALPCQVEKESGNCAVDWGKRVVFQADLEPGRMNRFDCRLEILKAKPKPQLEASGGKIHFRSDEIEVEISTRTGLVDRYRVGAVDLVGKGAFAPVVMRDNSNPWQGDSNYYNREAGRFRLMSREEGTRFAGLEKLIPSVRVIEDGPVRSIVEAVFAFETSRICQRYKLPKRGTQIEVETRVLWNERERMLKLAVPLVWKDAQLRGQVMAGADALPSDGCEAVAQKWVAATSESADAALTCITESTYGLSLTRGALMLTLLRSPIASCMNKPIAVDRHEPSLDQGERVLRYWFDGGAADAAFATIDRRALALSEQPYALSFFPNGEGPMPKPCATLSDQAVLITAIKRAEESDDAIVRLHEPTGRKRTTTLSLPFLGIKMKVALQAFEVKTLRIDPKSGRVQEANLLEEPLEG